MSIRLALLYKTDKNKYDEIKQELNCILQILGKMK
jgi:hypothetical protein